MKKEDLFQALGEIDDAFLDENVTEIKYSTGWITALVSIAACIAFTAGLIHSIPKPPASDKENIFLPVSETQTSVTTQTEIFTKSETNSTFTETVQIIQALETETFTTESTFTTPTTETFTTESTFETTTTETSTTESTFEATTTESSTTETTFETTTTETSTIETTSATTTTETSATESTTTTTTENPYASLQHLFTEVDGVYYAKAHLDEAEWVPNIDEVLTADGDYGAASLDMIHAYPDKTYAVWIAIAQIDADEENMLNEYENKAREEFNTTFTIEGYTLEQAQQENNTRILSYFNRSSTWKYVNIAEAERLTAGTCEIIGYNQYFNRIWIEVTKEQLESLPFSNHFGYLIGTMAYQDKNYFTLKQK